jgi:phytoene/squalene synthetase
MSVQACAALVERGDPDRFLATMAAPPEARSRLWPLYAYNLEIARAPWTSAEPLIGGMRLQWWIDTVLGMAPGTTPKAHEVAAPLAELVAARGLPVAVLAKMAEARLWDCEKVAFVDRGAFDAHIDATAGNLMWLAALSLGAPAAAEPVVRDFAWGAGVAAWLRAVPDYEARGCYPLVDGRVGAVAALARDGLARIARARASRHQVAACAGPALLPGWQAAALLTQAARTPARVADGTLDLSDFTRKGSLLLRALSGRW